MWDPESQMLPEGEDRPVGLQHSLELWLLPHSWGRGCKGFQGCLLLSLVPASCYVYVSPRGCRGWLSGPGPQVVPPSQERERVLWPVSRPQPEAQVGLQSWELSGHQDLVEMATWFLPALPSTSLSQTRRCVAASLAGASPLVVKAW